MSAAHNALLTLRLPKDLDRALTRQAKARGVKKSQLVREAVTRYLEHEQQETPEQLWERLKPFVGSVDGDFAAAMQDPMARQIYENNFRD